MANVPAATGDEPAISTAQLTLERPDRALLERRHGPTVVRAVHGAIREHGKRRPDERRRRLKKPGEVGDPVGIGSKELTSILRRMLVPEGGPRRLVWHHRGSRTVVHLNQSRVHVADGAIIVGVTLETAETGKEELTIPFAVGSEEEQVGTLAATERLPRGHRGLAEVWGEGVIALAWKALLEIADLVSAIVGGDVEGGTVRVGGLVAGDGELQIVPQARHEFETPRPPRRELPKRRRADRPRKQAERPGPDR